MTADSPDFIGQYDDALNHQACDAIISRFLAGRQSRPGVVGSGVRPELKNSDDINISRFPQWRDVVRQLNAAAMRSFAKYVREFPFSVLAPFSLELVGPDDERRRIAHHDMSSLSDPRLEEILRTLFRPGTINIQRYRAGVGGYPCWHCEASPSAAGSESLHRALLWTLYLNDEFERGETEFYHQRCKIAPKKGMMLIAPTAFTHTHRGNTPVGADKYIATSWVLYRAVAPEMSGDR